MKPSKQQDRILDFLHEYKSITPMDAWKYCGVYRLSDAIFKLRNKGYNIKTERLNVENKYGEKCLVANYMFESEV